MIFLVSVLVNVFNLFVFAFLVVVNPLEENKIMSSLLAILQRFQFVIFFIFLKCLHHLLNFRLFILKNKVCVTVFAWRLSFVTWFVN